MNNRTLILEDNYVDLTYINLNNYDNLIMRGCIFVSTPEEYYETCDNCGVQNNNNQTYTYLFDLSTKFLLHNREQFNNMDNSQKSELLNQGVCPGELEIDFEFYDIYYNAEDYFRVVNEIMEN